VDANDYLDNCTCVYVDEHEGHCGTAHANSSIAEHSEEISLEQFFSIVQHSPVPPRPKVIIVNLDNNTGKVELTDEGWMFFHPYGMPHAYGFSPEQTTQIFSAYKQINSND
jgi:hypothetical protein